MPKIELEIKNCKECPHWSESPYPTEDSFERPHYWWCNYTGERIKIAGYVEWHEEKDMKVPEWCPIKKEK